MTILTFRAMQQDRAIHAAIAAAPLYRGRILRGLAASGCRSVTEPSA
ncbi:hypothetical protein C8J26_3032 [Sphingomonas aurantiaca]|uniref:Uncharacterized protein n=1 Tax=Sphingomonas aurantiaca TaxID=185949 RepID=A0A2T5GIZ2_9SPHN|nr:hypothetical protein [Sphingomonas aurantiaca]PTQ59290.1 hypothetical protein C8J26_3032 [Sphingomonas aurantiaca]